MRVHLSRRFAALSLALTASAIRAGAPPGESTAGWND